MVDFAQVQRPHPRVYFHGYSDVGRFWAYTDKLGPDDCWEWQGYRNRHGYGYFGSADLGRYLLAHRYSYMRSNRERELPAGIFICHHCDNPSCVNPLHLFPGTNADNVRDMISKGRASWQKRRMALCG